MITNVLERVRLSDDPKKLLSREVVRAAVAQVAKDNQSKVHASWTRAYYPDWLDPHQIGAEIAGLVLSGDLVWTGAWKDNGDYTSGNALKQSKVYELVNPAVLADVLSVEDIPQEDPFPPADELGVPSQSGSVPAESYEDFIADKVRSLTVELGFEIPDEAVHPMLLPHQRDIVRWAVKGGRRAIFAAFGLGKSFMQLETVRLCLEHEGPEAKGLIIMPLGVRQEFVRDAAKLDIPVSFVRRTDELDGSGIYLTNYESVRDGKLDPNQFAVVSLDEASVLRGYGTKTYQSFLTLFGAVRYRFVATATPSPNRYKELIHYAGFLGIMDTGQALTRFFQRDSTKANNLTLYPHKEREFWLWLHSWAIFLQMPSDLGYSDEGYVLPPIEVRWHVVDVDQDKTTVERDGQAHLYRDASIGLQDAAREKRETIPERVAKTVEIVNAAPDDHFILWHDLEDERHALKKAIPEAVEVYGSQDLEVREQRIIDFSDGEYRLLATKPVIAGSGCNFQRHCHRAVFTGATFKFNDFIQAIHRIQRFQQSEPVIIDIIYAESEAHVVEVLKEKWVRHEELVSQMSDLIREYGLAETGLEGLVRSIGVERHESRGETWTYVNNDTVAEARLIDDDSIGLIFSSYPFSNHYEYTPSYLDFGHTDSNGHFWSQMEYLTPELYRILEPGRILAVHVKDRILFGSVTGAGIPTVSPFHAEAIFHTIKHGFDYVGMITIVTDVVRENNQTYRLSYGEMLKDSSKMGVGSPEYVLLFHKPQSDKSKGYADSRIEKDRGEYSLARWQVDAHAFWRDSGNRLLTPEELAALSIPERGRLFAEQSLHSVYDYEAHVKAGELAARKKDLPGTFMNFAPPSPDPMVWTDVNRMRTLNSEQRNRALNLHVCPLQLDTTDRIIERFSNPGDWVYDPFGGIATVPSRAVRLGRKGRGVELNPDYYRDGITYCEEAERDLLSPDLFALLDLEGDNQ